MEANPDFARVERALRDEVIEHYHARGESLEGDAGLRTLDTTSTLVPARARLLLDLYERRSGRDSIEGTEVADLGCGFGALSLYFASEGARVHGEDPNVDRLAVGARLARRLQLDASFSRAWLEETALPDATFDLAVINNSLCYVTNRNDRRRALAQAFRILRPGGWLVIRDPSGSVPLDPFTGIPLVHWLPGAIARPLLRLSEKGRTRSSVRLMSKRSARRALRRAGFQDVRSERGPDRHPGRYLHLTARRPDPPRSSPAGRCA